jgi:hypothetical protein
MGRIRAKAWMAGSGPPAKTKQLKHTDIVMPGLVPGIYEICAAMAVSK